MADAAPSDYLLAAAAIRATIPPHPDPDVAELEAEWDLWLCTLFPEMFTAVWAEHHEKYWEHVWSIVPNLKPPPYVCVWGRGGAKSSSAEATCVALGVRGIRRYGLYVSSKQAQADDHVGNVATMLESPTIGEFYPEHAGRALSKYGAVKGWRRNRLRTAGGFTLDALGLDVASRGLKVDESRPDFMIFDDLDEHEDTELIIAKKVESLTRKIIAAETKDEGGNAIFAIQNLVSTEGIFGQLSGRAEKPAEYLVDRIVSGPIPAIIDMKVDYKEGRWVIVGGTPTWDGMDLEACQNEMDAIGLSAFRIECQHEVDVPAGGMYDHLDFKSMRLSQDDFKSIQIDKVELWVDPAVTKHDTSDSHAIQVDALGRDGILYRLFSWEQRATPVESLTKAFRAALEYGSPTIGIETDQGGDTWKSVFREAREAIMNELLDEGKIGEAAQVEAIRMKSAKAGEGHGSKVHRSSRMLVAYERCVVRGTFIETSSGSVPIEYLAEGDLVWTRSGLRPVTAVRRLGVESVLEVISDGQKLVCTPDHPVFVVGEGFVHAGELARNDTLLLWAGEHDRNSALTAENHEVIKRNGVPNVLRSIVGEQTHVPPLGHSEISMECGSIWTAKDISAHRGKMADSLCIERYGPKNMDQSHQEPTSIMWMGTPSTTNFRTWLQWEQANTLDTTIGSKCQPVVSRPEPKLQKRHESVGRLASPKSVSVSNADSNTHRSRFGKMADFALPPATRLGGTTSVRDGGVKEIWTIQVAGTPEYFANGILTHNSRVKHVVGTHDVLESALRRFPKIRPFDLVDCAYWSFHHLAGKVPASTMSAAGRRITPNSIDRNRRRLRSVV